MHVFEITCIFLNIYGFYLEHLISRTINNYFESLFELNRKYFLMLIKNVFQISKKLGMEY